MTQFLQNVQFEYINATKQTVLKSKFLVTIKSNDKNFKEWKQTCNNCKK